MYMLKKLLALLLAAMTVCTLLIAPVCADTFVDPVVVTKMYVYTENGLSLNVRCGESTNSPVVGTLAYGAEVTTYGYVSKSGWIMVDFQKGKLDGKEYDGDCFVQARFLVKNKPEPHKDSKSDTTPSPDQQTTDYAKVVSAMNDQFASAKKVSPYTVIVRPSRASGYVNFRWAPTTEANRITTYKQGKELTVLYELRNWYMAQDPESGTIGYIYRTYTTVK